jgi:hypothetical protein
MGNFTSPGGTLVCEIWADGGIGQTWGSASGKGGGGGSYARVELVTAPGDILQFLDTGAGGITKLTVAAVIKASAGNGGAGAGGGGVATVGDVLYNGGSGANASDVNGFNDDGGGGGGPALRDTNGVSTPTTTSILGGVTSPGNFGGEGGGRFSSAPQPPESGSSPGGGGGGAGNGNPSPGGSSGGYAVAVWTLANWNGNPQVGGTLPVSGASPLYTEGAPQPAPPALDPTQRAAFVM